MSGSVWRRRCREPRRPERARRRRAASTATRVLRPEALPALEALSLVLSRWPLGVNAHARPKRGKRRNGIGAHLEGPEVEVAGRARRAPTRIFATRLDKLDLRLDFLVAERGRSHFEPVADLQPLDQILAQIEPKPDVVEVVEREKRHAGRDIFPELRSDLIDLRGDRRLDRELVDVGLDRVDARLRLEHIGPSNLTLFLGRAIHRLVIGQLGAVLPPPRDFERVRRLVEPLQRRIARAGKVLDAGVSLVGELEIGLGALKRSFLLRNDFRARADQNVGELGLCDVNAGLGLAPFGDQLRIVDLKQQLPGGDVLPALDGTLADSAVDPRGDVDAGRVGFALDDERLRPRQIPDREAHDPRNDERYDGRSGRRASRRPFALRFGFGAIFRRWALFYVRHAMLVSRRDPPALIVARRRAGAPA